MTPEERVEMTLGAWRRGTVAVALMGIGVASLVAGIALRDETAQSIALLSFILLSPLAWMSRVQLTRLGQVEKGRTPLPLGVSLVLGGALAMIGAPVGAVIGAVIGIGKSTSLLHDVGVGAAWGAAICVGLTLFDGVRTSVRTALERRLAPPPGVDPPPTARITAPWAVRGWSLVAAGCVAAAMTFAALALLRSDMRAGGTAMAAGACALAALVTRHRAAVIHGTPERFVR